MKTFPFLFSSKIRFRFVQRVGEDENEESLPGSKDSSQYMYIRMIIEFDFSLAEYRRPKFRWYNNQFIRFPVHKLWNDDHVRVFMRARVTHRCVSHIVEGVEHPVSTSPRYKRNCREKKIQRGILPHPRPNRDFCQKCSLKSAILKIKNFFPLSQLRNFQLKINSVVYQN